MRVRRLGWAGIEITAQEGSSLVVDYVHGWWLLPATLNASAYAAPVQPAVAALVTHLHDDHTDVSAIQTSVGPSGLVLRPPPTIATAEEAPLTCGAEAALAASGLKVATVVEWERVQIGPFAVTPVPAVDGLGDPQVNWVIEADGQRVFHGGDTMFHGYWWLIARRTGPIDVAVLPINGPLVNDPGLRPPSSLPAVLTPEQAVQAAALLQAKTIVPMHFGVPQPSVYTEQADALSRLRVAADELGLGVTALAPGDSTEAVPA
jgi:L-ascorbate metabolism protein UlaG (beta-lactamase superfamily)